MIINKLAAIAKELVAEAKRRAMAREAAIARELVTEPAEAARRAVARRAAEVGAERWVLDAARRAAEAAARAVASSPGQG